MNCICSFFLSIVYVKRIGKIEKRYEYDIFHSVNTYKLGIYLPCLTAMFIFISTYKYKEEGKSGKATTKNQRAYRWKTKWLSTYCCRIALISPQMFQTQQIKCRIFSFTCFLIFTTCLPWSYSSCLLVYVFVSLFRLF